MAIKEIPLHKPKKEKTASQLAWIAAQKAQTERLIAAGYKIAKTRYFWFKPQTNVIEFMRHKYFITIKELESATTYHFRQMHYLYTGKRRWNMFRVWLGFIRLGIMPPDGDPAEFYRKLEEEMLEDMRVNGTNWNVKRKLSVWNDRKGRRSEGYDNRGIKQKPPAA